MNLISKVLENGVKVPVATSAKDFFFKSLTKLIHSVKVYSLTKIEVLKSLTAHYTYLTFDEYSPLSLYTKDNNSATTWYKDAGISLFKSTCERR